MMAMKMGVVRRPGGTKAEDEDAEAEEEKKNTGFEFLRPVDTTWRR